MKENTEEYKEGTFIHGVAASEHIDSSGERIKVSGIDISSLTKDGIFNLEHNSKEASQMIGKILEAKKILKESDCANDSHKKFWNKLKTPFIYVYGELFDGVGHQAAKDISAMLRYDEHMDKRKTKKLINFSIEGSTLAKEGNRITKCIARKVSITLTPCNKVCEAEIVTKPKENMKTKKSVIDKILGKSEDNVVELVKAKRFNNLYTPSLKVKLKPKAPSPKESYTPITPATDEHRTGTEIKPKRVFKPGQEPDKMKVGDRITYKKPKGRTGRDIYTDPDTFKSKDLDKSTRAGREHDKKVASGEKSKWEAKYKPKRGKEKGVHHADRDFNRFKDKKKNRPGQSEAGSYIKGNKRRATSDWGAVSSKENKEDVKVMHQKVISEQKQIKRPNLPKSDKYMSNVRKALIAGSGMGAPSAKTGTAALSKEDMKIKMVEVCKSISNDNWETFHKREQLTTFIQQQLPKLNKKQVLALSKVVAYMHEKKKEAKLAGILDE